MMRKRMKNIIVLALSLVMMGSVIAPMQVSATDADAQMYKDEGFALNEIEDKVLYKPFKASEMSEYFGNNAPEMDGYYFGGWYENKPGEGETDLDCVPIKYTTQKKEIVDENPNAEVYAKFVPAYLLSVKVQNNASIYTENDWEKTPTTSNRANIRIISAIDSTRYKEVGFHLFVKETRVWAKTTSTYNKTVYSTVGVYNAKGERLDTYTPEQLYDLEPENYEPKFIAGNFTGIPQTGWKASIFVRPYWVTFDGVEVRGTGRYIHVEDGIKGYVAVPISMQGLNNGATGVVAGTLDVEYDSTKLEYLDTIYTKSKDEDRDGSYDVAKGLDGNDMKYVECKPGADLNQVIAKEISVPQKDTGTIGKIRCAAIRKKTSNGKISDHMVSNYNPNQYASVARHTVQESTKHDDADTFEAVNNLYVMLRFKRTDTNSTPKKGEHYQFNISNISFCDTNETPVSVNMWDVRY